MACRQKKSPASIRIVFPVLRPLSASDNRNSSICGGAGFRRKPAVPVLLYKFYGLIG